MALTNQDILDRLAARGVDTPEKFDAFIVQSSLSLSKRIKEREIANLQAAQATAMAPFNEQIRPIETDRAATARGFQDQIAIKRAEIDALDQQLDTLIG